MRPFPATFPSAPGDSLFSGAHLQPAHRNLLACLRGDEGPSRRRALDLLSHEEWAGVVHRAAEHRVSPLLFRQVRALDMEQLLPAPVYQGLRRTCLRIAAWNIRRFHELSRVLGDLKRAGMPVIVLKGAYLAETVYGDAALREMQDVDILVRKEDLARCHELLKDAGVLHSPNGLLIDLHWDIETNVLPLRVDMEALWRRVVPATVAGVEVLALCPADLVLHLCVHLANHHLFRQAGLRTLFDIRECIAHLGVRLNWDTLVSVAKSWRAGNAVFLSLAAAKELAGAEVPSSVLEGLKPEHDDASMKAWAYHQIFYGKADDRELSPNFCLLLEPGPVRQKLRRLLALGFPPREIVSQRFRVRYRSGSNYAHYLVRLRKLLPVYGRAMWGMIRGDGEITAWVEDQRRRSAVKKWLAGR